MSLSQNNNKHSNFGSVTEGRENGNKFSYFSHSVSEPQTLPPAAQSNKAAPTVTQITRNSDYREKLKEVDWKGIVNQKHQLGKIPAPQYLMNRLPNTPDHLPAFVGSLLIGPTTLVVQTACSTRIQSEQLLSLLYLYTCNDDKAKTFVTNNKVLDNISASLNGRPITQDKVVDHLVDVDRIRQLENKFAMCAAERDEAIIKHKQISEAVGPLISRNEEMEELLRVKEIEIDNLTVRVGSAERQLFDFLTVGDFIDLEAVVAGIRVLGIDINVLRSMGTIALQTGTVMRATIHPEDEAEQLAHEAIQAGVDAAYDRKNHNGNAEAKQAGNNKKAHIGTGNIFPDCLPIFAQSDYDANYWGPAAYSMGEIIFPFSGNWIQRGDDYVLSMNYQMKINSGYAIDPVPLDWTVRVFSINVGPTTPIYTYNSSTGYMQNPGSTLIASVSATQVNFAIPWAAMSTLLAPGDFISFICVTGSPSLLTASISPASLRINAVLYNSRCFLNTTPLDVRLVDTALTKPVWTSNFKQSALPAVTASRMSSRDKKKDSQNWNKLMHAQNGNETVTPMVLPGFVVAISEDEYVPVRPARQRTHKEVSSVEHPQRPVAPATVPDIEEASPKVIVSGWFATFANDTIKNGEAQLVALLCHESIQDSVYSASFTPSYYQVLDDLEPEDPTVAYVSDEAPRTQNHKAKNENRGALRGDTKLDKRAKDTHIVMANSLETPTRARNAIERADNYKNAFERHKARFSKDLNLFARWLYSMNPTTKYAQALVDAIIPGLAEKTEIDTQEFAILSYVQQLDRTQVAIPILYRYKRWNQLMETTQPKEVPNMIFEVLFSTGYEVDAIRECESLLHNKQMHSYNGNPIYVRSMEDIDANKDAVSLYADSVALSQDGLKDSSLALNVNTVPSQMNPSLQDVYTSSFLRAPVINADSTQADGRIQLPGTSLLPRRVRNNLGVLTDSTNRLPFTALQPIQVMVSPLADSPFAVNIVTAGLAEKMYLGRPDNTTVAGWNNLDIVKINNRKAYYGWNPEQFLLKIEYLAQILNWVYDRHSLPLNDMAKIDGATKFTDRVNTSLTFLDFNTNIYGERCGGVNAPVFPYVGSRGSIAFHLSLATVPQTEYANVIYIPASLLTTDQDVDIIVALFVMGFAEYPFTLLGVMGETSDDADGNVANQNFMHAASCVRVPGMLNIHVIIPRGSQSSVFPGDQVTAKNVAAYVPRAGALAIGDLLARQELDFNIDLENPIEYNLADYLCSFILSYDVPSIAALYARLNMYFAVSPSLKRVRDIMANTSVLFGPTVCSAPAAYIFPANSAVGWSTFGADHVRRQLMTADVPSRPSGYNYLVFQSDPTAWNKLAMNLAVATGDLAVSGENQVLPEWVANPLNAYWLGIRAIAFAITFETHMKNLGWAPSIWSSIFSTAELPVFQNYGRSFFTQGAPTYGALEPSDGGQTLAALFVGLFNKRPAVVSTKKGLLTFFDTLIPPPATLVNQYNTCYDLDNAGWSAYIMPTLLLDIHFTLFAVRLPKWMLPFSPPNSSKGTYGYTDNLTQLRTATRLGGYQEGKWMKPVTDSNEMRDDSDEARWNARLLVTSGFAQLFGYQEVVNGGSPLAGSLPFLPYQDIYFGALTNGMIACSTTWNPIVTRGGGNQFMLALIANVIPENDAMLRRTPVRRPVWQIGDVTSTADYLISPSTTFKGKYFTVLRAHSMKGKETKNEEKAPSAKKTEEKTVQSPQV